MFFPMQTGMTAEDQPTLEPKINIPPADVLYNIKYVFRKVTVKDESGKSKVMNISQNYPEFFDGSIKMTSRYSNC